MNVTLYEKRDCASVIKLRILKWGDYPRLFGGGLNAIISILTTERQNNIQHKRHKVM